MSRKLEPIYLLALGVDATVGLGIYVLPGKLVAHLGRLAPLVFPVGGLALALIALCFARLSRLTARNGGPYTYAALAFGPRAAFPLGWSDWAGAALGIGALAGSFAGFVADGLPGLSPLVARFAVTLYLVALAALNAVGARPGAKLMALFTAAKLVPLVALGAGAWFYRLPAAPLPARPHGAEISECLLMTLFLLQGFELVPAIAGEAERPRATVPRAILLSLFVSVGIYTMLVGGIATSAVAGTARPLAVAAAAIWGTAGEWLLGLGALASILGLLAGRMLAAPRYLMPLCDDHFGTAVSSRWAIVITLAVAVCVSWKTDFDDFVGVSALGVALQYAICGLSLIKLSHGRDRRLGIAALAVSLGFLSQTSAHTWRLLAIGNLVGIFAYALFYFVQHRGVVGQQGSAQRT